MKAAERYLALIAERCRDAYIRERTHYDLRRNPKLADRKPPYRYRPAPKWDGGEDDAGYEHQAIWPKIAAYMIEHGLDPYTCVRKRFEMVRGGVAPWPNQIAQPAHLDIYKGDSELLSVDQVRTAFDLEKEYCRMGLNSTRFNRPGVPDLDIWKSLLLDDTVDISPLMRYCVATELKLHDVAKVYHLTAMSQYMVAPKVFNAIWGKAIPRELSEQAEEVLANVNLKRKRDDGQR
jgi:hypothetical protein